ncbi:MAG: hypothetical protein HN738_10150 [Gammaproteobacteria bacterium]|nr:hypothetical protein [Gammaproteobacteria bacterium]
MTIGFDRTGVRTSAEGPEVSIGTRFVFDSPTTATGQQEYMYVETSEAVTAEGYLCVVDSAFVAEMADTTSTAPGAGVGRPVGAAQAAIASGGYGWIQIYGKGPIRTLASAAKGTALTSSATPGAVDDATTAGLEVIDGLSLGTATGGGAATNTDGFFNYPVVGRTL